MQTFINKLRDSFSRRILTFSLVAAVAISVSQARAQSDDTWLCNAANETLYLTVRHYGHSLLRANAYTEGWIRLPTRGLTRSCWVESRRSRDQIVVAGVKRGDEIVPITMTPRNINTRRREVICVARRADRFDYYSESRSDGSCGTGFQLARASFTVIDGEGRVDIDLGGRIDVPLTDAQREQVAAADRQRAAAARRADEKRRQEQAAKEAAEAEYKRKMRLSSSEYMSEIEAYMENEMASSSQDIAETIEAWITYLNGVVLRLPVMSSSEKKDDVLAWRSRPPPCDFLCFPTVMVARVDRGAPIPDYMRDFASVQYSNIGDVIEKIKNDDYNTGGSEFVPPAFRNGLMGSLTDALGGDVLIAKTPNAVITIGSVKIFPHLNSDGTFSNSLRTALCLDVSMKDFICSELKVVKDAGRQRVDMGHFLPPQLTFAFGGSMNESVAELP